jgi:uncharacterized protein Yka (UPF0111/DUF47 family)
MTESSTEPAGQGVRGLLARLKSRVLPEMPDFYALLIEQSQVTARGTAALTRFLQQGDAASGAEVGSLEHEGDRIKAKNLSVLHQSFATPMDREDFYDAVMAIDEVLNYAKDSVREVQILEISPDERMGDMAALLDAGAQALLLGFRALQHEPAKADGYAERARKIERDVEKVYRHALASLFDPVAQLERLRSAETAVASDAALDQRSAETLEIVTQMLKRREIYRHLSNSADHVAHAAQVLEDIVTKSS